MTLTSSANPSTSGAAVTFTADVRKQLPPFSPPNNYATGAVQFTVDGNALGAPVLLSAGRATKTTTPSAGWHQVVATFTPDADTVPNSASLLQIVETPDAVPTSTTVTSGKNPSVGGPVVLSAKVTSGSGTPSGAVQLWTPATGDIGTPVTLNGSGVASVSYSPAAAGTHAITAKYLPNAGFRTSTGTLNQVIHRIPTPITATPVVVLSNLQTPLRLEAQLRDGRTGAPLADRTVWFSADLPPGALCAAQTNAAGVATCPVDVAHMAPLLLSLEYRATYGGDLLEEGAFTTADLIHQ